MKNTIKHALKAGVVAAALAFAGVAHANDTEKFSYDTVDGGAVFDFGTAASFNSIMPQVGIAIYELTSNTTSQQFLAFCIQPTVDALTGATYTAHYGATVSDDIKRLYSSSYSSTVGDTDARMAFQLALWELNNDDSNLYSSTTTINGVTQAAKQYFTQGADDHVDAAAGMLALALDHNTAIDTRLTYTTFSGALGGDASQGLLAVSVSAVPEVDTWAMLAAGLGLLGLVSRRKAGKSATFA